MLVWLKKRSSWAIVLGLGLWLAIDVISYLVAEGLWFEEVGYLSAFMLRIKTKGILWAIGMWLSGMLMLGNLGVASRLKHPRNLPEARYKENNKENSKKIVLGWLLFWVLGLTLLLGLLLVQYGNVAIDYWHPNQSATMAYPELPPRFRPESILQTIQQLPDRPIELVFLLGLPIAICMAAEWVLSAIAIAMSLGFGLILSGHWARILQYFHPTPFNSTDPLFGQDISFYVFTLPVLHLLEFWLVVLSVFTLVAIALVYLLSGNSLSQGIFPGFSVRQRRHLQLNTAGVLFSVAYSYWLSRYELLYSPRGVTYGASYTDVTTQLPLISFLSWLAGAIVIILLLRVIFLSRKKNLWPYIVYTIVLFLAIAGATTYLVPEVVQSLVVQPNELERETPYIERSISFTRAAFGLEDIEVQPFAPQGNLTFSDLQNNQLTIKNIRLWDTRPLLQTNRQLQQIRLYYKFKDADIERYTLKAEDSDRTEKQQVILVGRELDYSEVPSQAQTWVNEHLVYTHGYGFTMSPVNTATPEGLPDYFVKDLGVDDETGEGSLWTKSQRIRDSIPIGKPRIYYGELTNNYVTIPSLEPELDYPSGDENVHNHYDGTGGVSIGSAWRRVLFAKYLKNWQMLLTRYFTPETKVLFRRNINQRIRAIAPFLQFDSDPYLVVANTDLYDSDDRWQANNYLYWIIDAYTTSDRYPYSDPGEHPFNYIRNSVKVIIDAYNGDVQFFIADPLDPMIATWQSIFPDMFQPLSALPITLQVHIRYPEDMFNIQSERLLTYHMTDTQVFYNREDQWRVPREIYGNETQAIEPYYLIMKLPTETAEELILLHPFTPVSRNNMIAWLAGRSDGEQYGKLLLYKFPKQQLIYGSEQIDALINQDPEISGQISLWNQQGSRAVQGNLLVIPIEQSLLYVEPLYLEATQNSLPTLVRVIVVYQNRIVMAQTLSQAFQQIFQQPSPQPASPAIIRPVEEILPAEELLSP
ncbi:MAG: UPF0182 family protein [Hormoscilla sp.]